MNPVDDLAWLEAHRPAYWAEPSRATQWLPEALARWERARHGPPSHEAVALALFTAQLLAEAWRSEDVHTLTEQALPWVREGWGEAHRSGLLQFACRMHLRFARIPEALAVLQELQALAAQSQRELDRAHAARALAHTLFAQYELPRALDAIDDALQGYEHAGEGSCWVDLHVLRAFVLDAMGDAAGRLAANLRGAEAAAAQRRWTFACNAMTGAAEAWATRGELVEAEAALVECRRYLALAGEGAERIAKEVWAVEAFCAAERGEPAQALALMKQVIALGEAWSTRRQLAKRLAQAAPWAAQAGQAEEALALLARSHALELAEHQDASNRESLLKLERIERQHAQAEQARSEEHARALQVQMRVLEHALEVQRELQAELVQTSKLATLGSLLAGLAHEMNTPVGNALAALSALQERVGALTLAVDHGGLTRTRLLQDLDEVQRAAALARDGLDRGIGLLQQYKDIGTAPDREPLQAVALPDFVRSVWGRVIPPGRMLSLRVYAPWSLHVPTNALADVLVQLFQNCDRHAFAPEATGEVRVRAWVEDGRMHLQVSDNGRGIAPELLPKVFDPYVSTQFGQGRSGLGLFVAQVSATQRLGGRLTAANRRQGGASFTLSWALRPSDGAAPLASTRSGDRARA